MSEVELVLDSMRKTGDCVSELESALGKHPLSPRHIPSPRYIHNQHPTQPKRRPDGFLAGLGMVWFRLHQADPNPYTQATTLDRLREKEHFLQEAHKQLRQLERSVDSLTEAVQATRKRL
jgi:hypothetical protein